MPASSDHFMLFQSLKLFLRKIFKWQLVVLGTLLTLFNLYELLLKERLPEQYQWDHFAFDYAIHLLFVFLLIAAFIAFHKREKEQQQKLQLKDKRIDDLQREIESLRPSELLRQIEFLTTRVERGQEALRPRKIRDFERFMEHAPELRTYHFSLQYVDDPESRDFANDIHVRFRQAEIPCQSPSAFRGDFPGLGGFLVVGKDEVSAVTVAMTLSRAGMEHGGQAAYDPGYPLDRFLIVIGRKPPSLEFIPPFPS